MFTVQTPSSDSEPGTRLAVRGWVLSLKLGEQVSLAVSLPPDWVSLPAGRHDVHAQDMTTLAQVVKQSLEVSILPEVVKPEGIRLPAPRSAKSDAERQRKYRDRRRLHGNAA